MTTKLNPQTCICGVTIEPEPILSDSSDNPLVTGVITPTLCEACSDRYEELAENADDYRGLQLAEWFLQGVA